jgi:dihydroorotase
VRYLIKNGSIIDPSQRVVNFGHILVEDGQVKQVFDLAEATPDIDSTDDDLEVIYAQACIVAPGFTDLHAHLREPGQEHKETIATGTMAAARGGFTTVCAMPNTNPPHDCAEVVRQVQQIARQHGHAKVEVIGAITRGRQGTTLTEMAEMLASDCIGFSDDGDPVSDPAIMRHAMHYASMLGVPIMSHCEEKRLNTGWAMHEGEISTRLGLAGYPAAAEEVQIARDIALAELTGAHLHICHVSTAGGVALIRQAKARGVCVTAEVTPHHLTLTDEWVMGALAAHNDTDTSQNAGARKKNTPNNKQHDELRSQLSLDPTLLQPYNTSTRVSPPLRTRHDCEALIEGVCDGTIDAIATDHAPHALVDKACEYGLAACGISGFETALSLVLSLVSTGALDLMNVVARFTEGPAQVLRRNPSTLLAGTAADIVIFDPEKIWTVDAADFVSKGKNTPLQGQQLKGQVMLTMCDGKIVFRRGDFGKEDGGKPKASTLTGILSNEEGE